MAIARADTSEAAEELLANWKRNGDAHCYIIAPQGV
jgi:hypothetical protein